MLRDPLSHGVCCKCCADSVARDPLSHGVSCLPVLRRLTTRPTAWVPGRSWPTCRVRAGGGGGWGGWGSGGWAGGMAWQPGGSSGCATLPSPAAPPRPTKLLCQLLCHECPPAAAVQGRLLLGGQAPGRGEPPTPPPTPHPPPTPPPPPTPVWAGQGLVPGARPLLAFLLLPQCRATGGASTGSGPARASLPTRPGGLRSSWPPRSSALHP